MTKTTEHPGALDTMRAYLDRLQGEQAKCVDGYGIVRPYMREGYQVLMQEIVKAREAITMFQRITED